LPLSQFCRVVTGVMAASLLCLLPRPAWADLVLSQLVVELQSGKQARQDVEVWNHGSEVLYVAVEPREIIAAGRPGEKARTSPDPEQLGLLVSPARMILQPGQRKLVRIAAIAAPENSERVFRVTVKPVVDRLSSNKSGLKILIGYDVLVLLRPPALRGQLDGRRAGNQLILTNNGNVSVELADGKLCAPTGKACEVLPGGRLYAGAEKKVPLKAGFRASYKVKIGQDLIAREF
jgi:P pilus assembly chaperone PapD